MSPSATATTRPALEYIIIDTGALFKWARLPGDAIFIIEGVLTLMYIC